MAGDSEMRIEALKKAYAEIILNTSKEAACRVMAAERKALCFHHDLVSLKEESLTMFLRLKENFNSKQITESEAKSYNQEMKIEELEAQLSEAEGIIVDLRDELKQVYEQLDFMRRHTQKQSLSENAQNSSPMAISPESNPKFVQLDCDERNVTSPNSKAQINKCSNEFKTGKYDITSMILEDRETELYKNGCTQRIRAFERNLSNSNFSLDHQPTTVSVLSEPEREDSGEKRGKLSDELINSEARLKTVSITVANDPFSGFCSENVKGKNQTVRSLRRSARRNSRYREAISSLKRPYHKKCRKSSQNPIDVNLKNPMEETECCESVSDELGKCDDFFTKTEEGLGDDTLLRGAQLFDVPISEGFESTDSQTRTQTQNRYGNERRLKFTFYRKRRKSVVDTSVVKKEAEKSADVRVLENRSLE